MVEYRLTNLGIPDGYENAESSSVGLSALFPLPRTVGLIFITNH